MRYANKTEQELIEIALGIQDASNLSGVVHSFSEALSRLWEIAHEKNEGTRWVNRHRISRLFADKIISLSGEIREGDLCATYK